MFAKVGVRLVFVAAFPGSKMDGCSFRLDDGTLVIGISGRGRRFDKVLFTLLHEVAHVLLGHLDNEQLIIATKAKAQHSDRRAKLMSRPRRGFCQPHFPPYPSG